VQATSTSASPPTPDIFGVAALVPWTREAQNVPRILFGEAIPVTGYTRRPPTRRARLPQRDAKLMAVHALIEGLQAGRDEIDRLRQADAQAVREAKAERQQALRTKTTAFVLYYVIAGLLVGTFWAAAHG